jgi:hypothetical protein
VAFLLGHFEIADYDTWKRETFDADPAGREQSAKNYVISRGVDDPSQVFVRVEFDSVEKAASFRERLKESRALEVEGVTVKTPPTIVEIADSADY